MTVAKSASQPYTRLVCVIGTTVDSISTDTEHHVGLLAIAGPLAIVNRA